ncbi:MAG: type II toxin-antitoxin system RelE family toxin [Chlorobium sp.]
MKLVISKRFVKDTQKIRDDRILLKLRKIIAALEVCGSLEDITEASGLSGYAGYYRISFDYRYRIGAYVADNTVELLRVGHREDFYKYFPPA